MSPINRIPIATYRLQFNREFTLTQATEILGYLAELGISDVYASPLFLAAPESSHGYDVCDFNRINPNLGTSQDFQRFVGEVQRRGLGLLVDMVPNHMGANSSNPWWEDVLKNGIASKYAPYFDIKWELRTDQKVVLPVLGDRYGEVLKRGELRLDFQKEELWLSYFSKSFPLSPPTDEKIKETIQFKPSDPASIHALKAALYQINEDREKLHEIIQAQHYRLTFWRLGSEEINYRRFFDVNDLISLRVEEQQVFDDSHRLIFEWLRNEHITGLRVDHPDGMWDPKTYFDRLQDSFRSGATASTNLFVVAEKILSRDEHLPNDWAVSGTTGYDYLNELNGVFLAKGNERQFTEFYGEFTGCSSDYPQVEYEAKKYVLVNLFPREVWALRNRLRRIADQTIEAIDFTTAELEQAIRECIATFPVYRTYVRADTEKLTPEEGRCVLEAIQGAIKRSPQLAPVLKFLESVLLLELSRGASRTFHAECIEFVMRFQQLTGPAIAKGVEDTAFYRYARFVSLNEVGGNPGQFGIDLETFHVHNLSKQQCWPHSLLATSTHDTKRGEDLRARSNVLSEIPDEWRKHVEQWSVLNRTWKIRSQSGAIPSANDEYLLYQTLVGSWTGESDLNAYVGRIQEYMRKATREAKIHTSWTDPNEAYEQATSRFIEAILHSNSFRESFEPFAKRIAFFGVFNSLSQLILKICSPGVPDFYQGAELWDFSLVDPDNRRPVDYNSRKAMLARAKATNYRELLAKPESGELKMLVTWSALQFRDRNRELFESGEYIPINAVGEKREHVVCFERRLGDKSIFVVAPKLPLTLSQGDLKAPIGSLWGRTEIKLPAQRYREQFTGRERTDGGAVAQLLEDFPAALFEAI